MKQQNDLLWPLMALLLLAWGCSGFFSPRVQLAPEKMAEQVPAPPKSALQEKLLAESSRAILADYKDYKVGPEDLLSFEFFGQDELNREARVNGQGEVTVPLVGTVQVAGLSLPQIEEKLRRAYIEGKYLHNPQISAFIKEYRHRRVMVSGAVVTPGSYEVIGPRSLLEMLGKAGGLSDKAGTSVHIIRAQSASELAKATRQANRDSFAPGTETIIVDLHRLLIKGAYDLNYPIKAGDIIYVPPAEMAYVLGAVKKPGQVAIKQKLTVTQALALTDGLDPYLASNRISIVRMDESGQRLTIPVNLSGVLGGTDPDVPLRPNDVVFVEESVIKRVLFNIRNLLPGSYGISAPLY